MVSSQRRGQSSWPAVPVPLGTVRGGGAGNSAEGGLACLSTYSWD